ncbi:acyl carrier protein [Cyanobacterium sp. Dongsha4]|uniref:acyl carrier protein n=1 Tax=Cyanobacterium sp. DS4 TaxID=2878255 RepID=UPI002E803F10|nr:acyl carrier protein [Cyanobacterium sp. Dongsha4]WVL00169.1 acyl carrier protein [Cyanobacterium sp. Dongsha4]
MSENSIQAQKSSQLLEVESWLIAYIAKVMEIESEKIEITIPLEQYGLDSRTALGMIADLEDKFGGEIDPTLIYQNPTIESLAKHLLAK